MPIGPLVYLYVRSLTEADFKLRRQHRWHFASGIVDLFPKVLIWVTLAGLITGWVQPENSNAWGGFIDNYNTYMDLPRWASITLYLLLTKRFLRRLTQSRTDAPPDNALSGARLKWIHQFLNAFLIFQAIWLAFLIPYLIPATRGILLEKMSYYPIYIPLAVLVYWLGFKGYMQTKLPAEVPAADSGTTGPGPRPVPTLALAFSDEEVAGYLAALKTAMEKDRLYLEPALNLQAVAAHTGIPPKTISFVLNNHQGKSFNEFVNEYRITEVKRHLLEPGTGHLTIAGLALECGFNSQATFQRAFRHGTGVSPKEYISQKKCRQSA
jgi:AraC-like DNA-binding protein